MEDKQPGDGTAPQPQNPTPQNQPQPSASLTPPAYDKKKNPVLMVIIAVISAIVAFLIVSALTSKKAESPQQVVDDLTTSEENKQYVSTEHGFKVDFPGLPEASKETLTLEGEQVPFTTYLKETDGGNKAHMVAVVEYPSAFDYSTDEQITTALNGSVNGSAQTIDGTIKSSEYVTFLGRKAISALITGSAEGIAFDYYTTNFFEGNTLYQIAGIGLSKADYDAFAATFQLGD